MALDRADTLIQGLQKDPKLYDTLKEISFEIKKVIETATITNLLTDPLYINKTVGYIKDDRFNVINLQDRFDKIVIGDPFGASPLAKVVITETTNDHTAAEVLAVKRSRADTTPPNTGFGANLAFRLQGFTVASEPEAGRVQVIWDRNQVNDGIARDSTISLWNMINNVLTRRLAIDSNGAVIFDATAYPSGRFLITGAAGEITTNANVLYDDVNDIVTFMSSQSNTANPNLIIDNNSTGDSYIRFISTADQSYSLGVDASTSQEFKLSVATGGNARPGNVDVFAIDASGRMGYGNSGPSTVVKFQIFDNTALNITLEVARADTLNTPILQLNQTSTGDVTAQWTLGGGNSFAIGIDNSDNDYFKISYGSAANATVGVNDRLIIDLSGRMIIGVTGAVFTAGRLIQLNHFEEGPWIHCISTFINPSIALSNTGAGGGTWQIIAPRTGGTAVPGGLVIRDVAASANRLHFDTLGNFVIGSLAALATNSNNGFVYIPTCAGTPTGTPTAFTGKVAMVYDTTNLVLYVYSGGAWRAH